MLCCKDLTVTVGDGIEILRRATVSLPAESLTAVVGPSGSGKSTFVHALLGTIPSTGTRSFEGKAFTQPEDLAGRVALAPQFSVVIPSLTVKENLLYAIRIAGLQGEAAQSRLYDIVRWTGLENLLENRASALSGGQTRRLGLALELAPGPKWLICDEVTSGLDPKSERQILGVLRRLQQDAGLTVICIIHNLDRLDSFDHVVVLHEGEVFYTGEPEGVRDHFGLHAYSELFEAMEKSEDKLTPPASGDAEALPPEISLNAGSWQRMAASPFFILRQIGILLQRRLILLGRDRGTLVLLALMTMGFPILVVIFALGGLPQIENLSLEPAGGMLDRLQESMRFQRETSQTGSLVSGLILFQVILLALMGSNNGSREIAGERRLYEKERLRGLSPLSYAAAKSIFVAGLAIVQGVYMCWFVKLLCGFPGDPTQQTLILVLVALSTSWVALAFSALMQSSEKASLLSIYLVGFQLPLSGIVLALPLLLADFIRPFIAAYWGWSGYLFALRENRLYDAVTLIQEEAPANFNLAVAMLCLQLAAALLLVLVGVQRKIPQS